MTAKVSIAEAHSHLSRWLKKVKTTPVTITSRGKPVGVIISPDRMSRCGASKPIYVCCNWPKPFGKRI
ncbi:MAG: type II toxin-antitoxin system Phd/YefM family antitoxin [Chloroflexi bacterium]|nr:type II toxin-antitoxin system Phd/YefM family antitoxin [Chloroflexota bacterium]